MGRDIKRAMKTRILTLAKEDIPLYFDDFKGFWDASLNQTSDDDLVEIYKRTLVFKNWKTCLHSLDVQDLDSIADELFEDINSTMYLALLGQYRSAFMHMRSSIELSLQLLYFLHHPIEYSHWLNGNFVIKFNVLTEYFEKHPNLNDSPQLEGLLREIFKRWKLYSKHIHAESPKFFQCEKDARKTNSFARGDFEVWKNNYTKNVDLINKLYLLFFRNDLNRFPKASRDILTSLLKDEEKDIINLPS